MKIMILTAATGGGHLSAASALEEYIRENTSHEVVTVDALKAIGRFLDKTICDSYLFMAKRVPLLFGQLYKQTNKPNYLSYLAPKINSTFSYSLNKAIHLVDPDVIISTHPFATEMISHLKHLGKISAKLLTVITDYGLHRAWIAEHVDGYIVACEDMIAPLMALGVPENKIHVFGIPVHKAFFNPPSREDTLKELGFSPEIPTVLFMAGSFGVSDIIKMYRSLTSAEKKLQMIVITGRNERLYSAFEEEIESSSENKNRTHLLFFTKEVQKYMNASDLIVTKPGGLTVSEALACNLPLAVFNAIPGQEEDNALFLENNGMGIRIPKDNSFTDVLLSLVRDTGRLNQMRENCRRFDKSDSVPQTVELAENLISPKSIPKKHKSISLKVKK
ncbi:MGDG synthase family glycosyltransferase [Scatolibacter rhodanostii]|uniref:MGDG synthase family glycosyltransferase n=1 Tax=Scatolibacter rhodanostii TaxID=2014781 RepID=UPI000C08C156|nr:glycosyltransferase [Scatolibacter rhodanostii]